MSRYLKVIQYHSSKGQQCNDVNLHDTSTNPYLADENHGLQKSENGSGLNHIDVLEDVIQHQVQIENTPETVQNESNQVQVGNSPEIIHNVSTENSVTTEKKHRGKTILTHVHARSMNERPFVIFKNLNQPVGPTEEIVSDLTRLLGTLAKDSTFAPLNYLSWKYMPFKDKIWEYVQKKFCFEQEGVEKIEKYVLRNVNEKWRLYKARVKEKYYKEHESMEERMVKRPEDISEDEFRELMKFWDTEKVKRQNDPNEQEPSRADVYIKSRKRKPERTYLTQNENIEKIKALKASENRSSQTDPYDDVITKKEHRKRVRTYGLGVTQSSLKKKDLNTPLKIPSVFLDKIKEEMENTVAEQVEKKVAEQLQLKISKFISKFREANQGRDCEIPELTAIEEDGSTSHDNSIRDHVDESEESEAIS